MITSQNSYESFATRREQVYRISVEQKSGYFDEKMVRKSKRMRETSPETVRAESTSTSSSNNSNNPPAAEEEIPKRNLTECFKNADGK